MSAIPQGWVYVQIYWHDKIFCEFLHFLPQTLHVSSLGKTRFSFSIMLLILDSLCNRTCSCGVAVTCLQCGGVSTTFQHFQDLLLDIRRASTLDDALAAYFCKERLDGDDAYRCERCQRKVSATKKFSLEKPPQVLCIQFKRYSILMSEIIYITTAHFKEHTVFF
jgi:ubiquitin C-terminal hydrolase